MTLRNKDGSVFKLSNPSPLPQTQDNWVDKIKIYNFDWENAIMPDLSEVMPIESDFEEFDFVEFDQTKEIKEAAVEIIEKPKEEVIAKEPEIEVKPADNGKFKVSEKNVVVMHCLPAIIKRHHDTLYDDVYATIKYGDKFIFEGIVVDRLDLSMNFWTNIELKEGSVVFPSHYKADETKFGDYRWWKVSSSESKSGGFLVTSIMSDYHPNFA